VESRPELVGATAQGPSGRAAAGPRRPPAPGPALPPGGQPATSAKTVGRNDPCPCGSGKKYKKCHGANA